MLGEGHSWRRTQLRRLSEAKGSITPLRNSKPIQYKYSHAKFKGLESAAEGKAVNSEAKDVG